VGSAWKLLVTRIAKWFLDLKKIAPLKLPPYYVTTVPSILGKRTQILLEMVKNVSRINSEKPKFSAVR
jgi:hypothetical protein